MVECNLAKVEVAGSNPVSRSTNIINPNGSPLGFFDGLSPMPGTEPQLHVFFLQPDGFPFGL